MSAYKIADIIMDIRPHHPETIRFLASYAIEAAQPDVYIEPAAQDEDELVELFRRISQVLLYRFDGMYLHSVALEYRKKVYLFVAPPGTGKSTHAALWKKQLGDRVRILNGDKPLLRWKQNKILVYGNPWQGKEGWGENASGILAGIYFLRRGDRNYVQPITPDEAVAELVHATEYPKDAEGVHKLLDFLELLTSHARLNTLYCTPEAAAVDAVLADIEKGDSL